MRRISNAFLQRNLDFNLLVLCRKNSPGELVIQSENGERRTLRSTPDWTDEAVNGDHLWVPTSASGDLCYVTDPEGNVSQHVCFLFSIVSLCLYTSQTFTIHFWLGLKLLKTFIKIKKIENGSSDEVLWVQDRSSHFLHTSDEVSMSAHILGRGCASISGEHGHQSPLGSSTLPNGQMSKLFQGIFSFQI